MGILDEYMKAVREARTMLTYKPGWSEANHTGSWRNQRPVLNLEKCNACGLCWLYCPDAAVIRGERYEINYDYCKGCGICAVECKRGAITMIVEEEE